MSALKILKYPHKNLRKIAQNESLFDEELHLLVENMFDTMYEYNGIGLAATQIDVHKRIVVMDLSEEKNERRVYINPTITVLDHELVEYKEGCLSIPDVYELVRRPKAVEITAQNLQGEHFNEQAEGLLAVCIQHEIDHLNGKLFIDYLSNLKKNRIKKQLKKQNDK